VKLAGAEGWVPTNKDLSYAKLKGSDMSDSDLSGIDLSSSDLQSANLSQANLQNANLNHAQLQGARLPPWSSCMTRVCPRGAVGCWRGEARRGGGVGEKKEKVPFPKSVVCGHKGNHNCVGVQ
jgi:hypothetical protein